MKKIIVSLSIMAMVAGVVIGATSAYFSDTETSIGNTFTAGTIDIKVDGNNPWTDTYTIPDIKPGETDYVNFGIENVGMNPAEIYKSIYGMEGTTGTVSEPECTEQSGYWDNPDGGCNWNWDSNNHTDNNDLQTQIFYDLSVKIYTDKNAYSTSPESPFWWQTIETGDETLPTVYPTDSTFIDLGMLPVGGYMFVEQSYHFNKDAGNEYQGDILTFNMKVEARQLAQDANGNATLTLEDKTPAPEYAVIDNDYSGTLTYKTKNPTFDFGFTGMTPLSTNYTLVIGEDPWLDPANVCVLGENLFSNEKLVTFTGTETCPSMTSAKAWLIPTTDWNSWTGSAGNWNQSNYLLEIGLVNYTQN